MNETVASNLLQQESIQSAVAKLSAVSGVDAVSLLTVAIFLVAVVVVVKAMALVGGLGTYAERKISADIQMRQGPNRVGPYGLLQFLADGIKMLLKEDILPAQADRFMFKLAPLLALMGVFASLAVLPFSSGATLTDLNVGVFYLLGVSSLVGVAVFLGGILLQLQVVDAGRDAGGEPDHFLRSSGNSLYFGDRLYVWRIVLWNLGRIPRGGAFSMASLAQSVFLFGIFCLLRGAFSGEQSGAL